MAYCQAKLNLLPIPYFSLGSHDSQRSFFSPPFPSRVLFPLSFRRLYHLCLLGCSHDDRVRPSCFPEHRSERVREGQTRRG